MIQIKRELIPDGDPRKNFSATVAGKCCHFVGTVPAVFRFVMTALRKTSGGSVMGRPGFVPTVVGSA